MRFHRTIMTPASHCKSRKRAAAVAARVAARVAQVAALELAVVAEWAPAAELRQVLAALAVVVPQPARGAVAVNAWAAAAVADAKACAARPAADAAVSTFGSASEIAATVAGMATALSFMAAAVALSS
jgi:hypothetical protein